MTNTIERGKHRAPRRSPLAGLAQAAASTGARRGVLVAASSGLVLTMAATTASAATEGVSVRPEAREATVSDTALASLTTPTVTVAADATFAVDAITVQAKKPEPRPEPARAAQQTSRAATRTAAAAAAPAAGSTVATGSRAAVLAIARQFIGVPYVYGGASPAGFDCSGFTQYVFAQVGVSLPRSSSAQRYAGTVVSAAQARPGDLVWWSGHVGIYTGGNQHIAARQPGTPLQEGQMYRSNPVFINVMGD